MNSLVLAATLALPLGQVEQVNEDLVRMGDYASCGVTSLYLIAKMHGKDVTWQQLKELAGPTAEDGTHSFEELTRAAQAIGLHAVGLQLDRPTLSAIPLPAIAQIRSSRGRQAPHLIVVMQTKTEGVSVLDPPYPGFTAPWSGFEAAWTGHVLLVTPDANLAEQWRQYAHSAAWTGPSPVTWVGLFALGAVIYAGIRWRRLIAHHAQQLSFARLGSGILAVIAIAVTGWACWAWLNPPPACCIIASDEIDFGEFPVGSHEITIPIRNTGGQALQITRISSTCACANTPKTMSIAANSQGELKVKIDVTPGPGIARLLIESNDPLSPQRLTLRWFGPAKMSPLPSIIMAHASLGKPYERTIRILYPGGKDMILPRFEGYKCGLGGVQIRLGKNNPVATPIVQSGVLNEIQGEMELHLSVPSPTEPKYVQAPITLKLSYGTSKQEIYLPVNIDFKQESTP